MKKTLLTIAVCALCMHLAAQDLDTIPYYDDNLMPDAGVFLPAPPDTNSMLFIDDFQQWIWGKSVRSTPRGQRASWESEYSVGRMCQIYSDAMGFTISKQATPAIYRLVSRGQKTAAQAVDRAKARYMRIRPFARMNEHVAGAFDDEEHLRGNGSYPSGHTSLGWTTALILAQMAPEQQDTILRRGWEYGESRVIVGAHWQSDVDAARLAASSCVARLQASPEYRTDLAAARAEYLLWHGATPANVPFPNSRRILPPPIDTASYRYQGDVAAHWLARSLRNTPRGMQALIDHSKHVEDFLSQYSVCLDMPLDTTVAPNITAYLTYVYTTLRAESKRLKNSGFRRRPYAQLADGSMIPDEEEEESTDSSYPSTHSTLGWGMALAMVQLTPDSMDAILERGFEYGYSRVIAGYHWASDVQAARLLASYTFVRMQREPEFQTLAAAARNEYASLRGYAGIASVDDIPTATLTRNGDNLLLTFANGQEAGVLHIYSIDGKVLRSMNVNGNATASLAGLPHGVYIATFTGRASFVSLKTTF